MSTYCLVDSGNGMPRWSTLESTDQRGLVWMDFKGRTVPHESGRVLAHIATDTILQIMINAPADVIKMEQELAYRHLLDPWSDQGWISPDGRFYGCAFYSHDDIAYALLRRTPASLEFEGWVRVHSDSFSRPHRDMPQRQLNTLFDLGFMDINGFGSQQRKYEADRNAPPPSFAVKAPKHIDLGKPSGPSITSTDGPAEALSALVARLRTFPEFAELFAAEHELIPDVGPGSWDWMIQWDHVSIGGPESAEDLLSAPGFELVKTSFDTIEILADVEPGLHMLEREVAMLAPNKGVTRPSRSMAAR